MKETFKYNYTKEDLIIGSTIKSKTSDELYTILSVDDTKVIITANSDNDVNKKIDHDTTYLLLMINTEEWLFNMSITNSTKKDRYFQILKNL